MKRSVIFVVLTYLASMTTNGFADLATCESYSKEGPKLDAKIISGLLGKEPSEVEEMMAWLDSYCQENPKDTLVAPVRKFLTERKQR